MQKIKFPDELNLVPESPGVYQFRNMKGGIIYIGKAKNLKNRVKSYAQANLLPKTAKMVGEATHLTFIEVESEFEALLLEANLIRVNLPQYNIELRDDKSPLYIGITSEEFPRVLALRKTQLSEFKLKKVFGPYLDGRSAKYVLASLRKIFPFSTHRIGKRACIYKEIGLCDPCPSEVFHILDKQERSLKKEEYLRNIRRLISVLSGNKRKIEEELRTQMVELAKKEHFEEAAVAKARLERFERTLGRPPKLDEYLADPNFLEEVHINEAFDLTRVLESQNMGGVEIRRIECFDVAHLAGTNPTASMVTFIDGVSDKRYYRHFKINKGRHQNSDVDSMAEVLTRRVKHFADWGKPDLIIIDGGKPQISAASKVLEGVVPYVGLAKRYETLVFFNNGEFKEILLADGPAKNLVVRMRDEAHRFARRLHHNLVTKTLLGNR